MIPSNTRTEHCVTWRRVQNGTANMRVLSLSLALVSALQILALGCSSSDKHSSERGTGDAGGDTADSAAGAGPITTGPEPKMPDAPADCPILATGTVTVLGQPVELWVGDKQPGKKGPVLLYWHGTGSTADEITRRSDGSPMERKNKETPTTNAKSRNDTMVGSTR